jgi:plastocyanin
MRSMSRRSISALVPALVAAAAIVLSPAAAAAATQNVTMNDGYAYNPNPIKVALGNTVKWQNNGAITKHDVNATKPNKYFTSGNPAGIHTGQSYAFTFSSAGTFSYICLAHSGEGMRGTVVVPMKVTRIAGSPERFKVVSGSTALPSNSPWVRVVQVDLPGGGQHYTVIKTTRAASFKYTPTAAGTYRFRSYLKSTSGAGQSQTSPVVSMSH